MTEQAGISEALNEARVGAFAEILLEEVSDLPGYTHIGRTAFQAPEIDGFTYVKAPGAVPGTIVPCRITGADVYDLFAESFVLPEGIQDDQSPVASLLRGRQGQP